MTEDNVQFKASKQKTQTVSSYKIFTHPKYNRMKTPGTAVTIT